MPTILHLDDNTVATKRISSLLKDFADLHVFTDISSAYMSLQDVEYSVFIIEYQLKNNESGFDFAEKIRSIPKYIHTPIILMTSNLTNFIEYGAQFHGINRCIDKLINKDELISLIQKQIHDPYIKQVELSEIEKPCLTWEEDGVFYLFSPALKVLLSADSQDNCLKALTLAIRSKENYKEKLTNQRIESLMVTEKVIELK